MSWLATLWDWLTGKKPKPPAPPPPPSSNALQLEDNNDLLAEDGSTLDLEQ